MAIKYINYTREQKRGMAVSGYSLYINGNHCFVHDTLIGVSHELERYPSYNDIEIYPVLKRRY